MAQQLPRMLLEVEDLLGLSPEVCKLFLMCLSLLGANMVILTIIDDTTISHSVRLQTLMACRISMVNRLSNSLKRPYTMAVLLSKAMRELDHTNLRSMEPINQPIAMPDHQRNPFKVWCLVSR